MRRCSRRIVIAFLGAWCASSVVAADAPTSQPATQAAALKAGEAFVQDIPGTLVKFKMVPIPGKKIWMGETELTWDAYDIWAYSFDMTDAEQAQGIDAKSRPSKPYGAPDWGFGHAGYPALSLTYQSADRFCGWLSKKTSRKYRLATEAEFQYACRGGEAEEKVIDKAELDKVAWFWDNAEDKTHSVAKKKPNGYGLYDMLGNAGEWCTAADGTPVLCGGTYDDKAENVHCKSSKKQTDDWNSTDPQNPKSKWWLSDGMFVGFRIVCEE